MPTLTELICSTSGEKINGIINLPTLKQTIEICKKLDMENRIICEGWTGFMISPDKNIKIYQILGVENGLYVLIRPDRINARITRNFVTNLERIIEEITGKRIKIKRYEKTASLTEAPWKMLYSQYIPREILEDQSLRYMVSKILDPFAKDVAGQKKIMFTSGEEVTIHAISKESLTLSEPFDEKIFTLNWAYYSCQALFNIREPNFRRCAIKILNEKNIPVKDFVMRFSNQGKKTIFISGGLKLSKPFLGQDTVEVIDDYGNVEWFVIDILRSNYPTNKIKNISRLRYPLDRIVLSLASSFKLDLREVEKFTKELIKNKSANLITKNMLIRLESIKASRKLLGKLYLVKLDEDARKVYGFSVAITTINFPTIIYNILGENIWPDKEGFQEDNVSKAFNLSAFKDGPVKIYQTLNKFFEDENLAMLAIKFVRSRLFRSKEEEKASQVLSYFARQKSRNMLKV